MRNRLLGIGICSAVSFSSVSCAPGDSDSVFNRSQDGNHSNKDPNAKSSKNEKLKSGVVSKIQNSALSQGVKNLLVQEVEKAHSSISDSTNGKEFVEVLSRLIPDLNSETSESIAVILESIHFSVESLQGSMEEKSAFQKELFQTAVNELLSAGVSQEEVIRAILSDQKMKNNPDFIKSLKNLSQATVQKIGAGKKANQGEDEVKNITKQALNISVDAGENHSVYGLSTVALDGSITFPSDVSSSDSQLTYHWTQLSGSPVSLKDSKSLSTSFSAPDEAKSTTLVFELTVSKDGHETLADQVHIQVYPLPKFELEEIASVSVQKNSLAQVSLSFIGTGTGLSCNGSYLSAESDSIELVSSESISWSGSWPNCEAYISPKPNQTGNSILTIVLSFMNSEVTQKSFRISVDEELNPSIEKKD